MARVKFLPISPAGATQSTGKPNNLPFPMKGTYDENPTAFPLTFFPLKVSLEKAVEYWWRIYSWNLFYSIEGFTGNIRITRVGVPQGSEQLLCLGENYTWTGESDVDPDGNHITSTIEIFTNQSPQYVMNHTDVVPAMVIGIDVLYFGGDSEIILTTANNSSPDEDEISFDGNILPVSYTDTTGSSFTFTITPIEWYSYDGIWNTATGAKN